MFLGKYFCRLNKEYCFLAPEGFKKHLTTELYITQGFDHNLWVLSSSAFQEIYKKLGHLNIADPMTRLLLRLILGAVTVAGVNERGTLKLPDDLRDYANIESEVFLIGQGDYFEVWSPELWDKQEVELRNIESNTERFSTFEITTR